MSKWQKYRHVEPVDVLFFERPADPANPPYPIQVVPCRCDAMDGHTCEQHRTPPTYSYCYRAPDRFVWIRPGEYLVMFADGRAMTVAAEELGVRGFEPDAGEERAT